MSFNPSLTVDSDLNRSPGPAGDILSELERAHRVSLPARSIAPNWPSKSSTDFETCPPLTLFEQGEDQGMVSEFVNPKFKDSSRTSFTKPTRLECMMQVRRDSRGWSQGQDRRARTLVPLRPQAARVFFQPRPEPQPALGSRMLTLTPPLTPQDFPKLLMKEMGAVAKVGFTR